MPALDLDSYTGLKLRKEGRILYANLDNPSRRNALTATMISDLHRLWTEVDEDDDVYVVVRRGRATPSAPASTSAGSPSAPAPSAPSPAGSR
jgi:hypothetical protein